MPKPTVKTQLREVLSSLEAYRSLNYFICLTAKSYMTHICMVCESGASIQRYELDNMVMEFNMLMEFILAVEEIARKEDDLKE